MAQIIPFRDLIESFNTRRCLLVLGPDIPRSADIGTENDLLDFIHRENPALKIALDLEGLYKCDARDKLKAYVLIKAYHTARQPNELLKQLAQIPFFSLIISVTPDLLLKKAFDEQAIPCDFAYYEPQNTPTEFSAPTANRPLIYNLFGSIENRTSLILTHQDLIAFVFSVLGDYKLPRQLKESIRNATGILFLGVSFDKWYVKLLLELFELKDKLTNAAEPQDSTPVQLRSFYSEHYWVDFIDADISEYVQALYDYCHQHGWLRVAEPSFSKRDQIWALIRNDELGRALDLVQDICDHGNTDLLNEVMNIEGRLSTLEKKIKKQLITAEEAVVERNRIREALSSTVDDLQRRGSGTFNLDL